MRSSLKHKGGFLQVFLEEHINHDSKSSSQQENIALLGVQFGAPSLSNIEESRWKRPFGFRPPVQEQHCTEGHGTFDGLRLLTH